MSKIPHIIHYCWIGGAPLPELAEWCIASWHKYMPDWEYMRWDESSFDIAAAPLYVRQAYEARKFAFVSDYVRLWALEQYGGLYMDVDFEVYRPFDELMDKYLAFAGYEGSKCQPVMQGVLASEPHGAWVKDMLATYEGREFIKADGSLDLTPNTSYFTDRLEAQGFVADGIEKDFYLIGGTKTQINTVPAINIDKEEITKNAESSAYTASSAIANQSANEQDSLHTNCQSLSANTDESDLHDSLQKNVDFINCEKNSHADEGVFMLHVFPVHYFCPQLTTGENVRNEETYCEHKGESSWAVNNSWKAKVLNWFSPKMKTKLIKLKRRIWG